MSETPSWSVPQELVRLPLADTSRIARKTLDLPYANRSPFQKLDVYQPADGAGPWPAIAFIHGGGWRECDKGDRQVTGALTGVDRGYVVVSLNHRLSTEAPFPAPAADIHAALEWLQTKGPEHGVDPDRLVLWGASAGAHLACLTGFRAPEKVRAIVAWYGPTDFSRMDTYLGADGYPVPCHARADSPESQLIGSPIGEVPDRVRQANPETWITPEAPPVLLQHGTRDAQVPWQLSRDLAERLRAACGPDRVQLDLIEGARHGGPEFSTPENLDRVFAFIDRWVAEPKR